tara:strand:+ start:3598 stop:4140 length:543 start_codon:yes stop_codon:yes gene_type:complete
MVIGVTDISLVSLKDRFMELILAPSQYTEMLWIAIPLTLTLFLTELYFSRYKSEELGWNSAYGNALVLIFVSLDIFRYLYNNNLLETLTIKLALAFAVAIMAVLLTLVNFLHIIPEKMAYGLSSKLPMNFIAYISLILIYSSIPIDLLTIICSATFLIIISLLLIILRSIIPSKVEEVIY